jgi:hypothetical protein
MMKKLVLLLATVLFNMSMAFAQKAVEGKVNDSKILKQLAKDAVKDPVYLKGDLEAWVNASNEFVIYAETKEKKYMFVLQMEKKRDIKPATGTFTELTFLDSSMVLNDGKSNYYLGIKPFNENELLKRAHMEKKDFVNFVDGYGLSRHAVPLTDKNFSLDKLRGAKSVFDYLEGKK